VSNPQSQILKLPIGSHFKSAAPNSNDQKQNVKIRSSGSIWDLFPSVAFSAKSGTGLFLFFQKLPVAADALLMKGLFKIGPGICSMASRTANSPVSLLQLALVKNVFSVFVDVMAVLAGEAGFDMPIVKEGDRRSSLIPKVFRMIQDDLIRLRLKRRSIQDRQDSQKNHQKPDVFSFHARMFLQKNLTRKPCGRGGPHNQLSEEASSS